MNTKEPRDGVSSTRLRSWEWWLLGAGVALWVFLPRYQFTNLTGDWFYLGDPWKSGHMKIGYVDSFESLGVHPGLSAGFWGNLLTWSAAPLSIRLLLTLQNRRWPVVAARSAIFVLSGVALLCAVPGLYRTVARIAG